MNPVPMGPFYVLTVDGWVAYGRAPISPPPPSGSPLYPSTSLYPATNLYPRS